MALSFSHQGMIKVRKHLIRYWKLLDITAGTWHYDHHNWAMSTCTSPRCVKALKDLGELEKLLLDLGIDVKNPAKTADREVLDGS